LKTLSLIRHSFSPDEKKTGAFDGYKEQALVLLNSALKAWIGSIQQDLARIFL